MSRLQQIGLGQPPGHTDGVAYLLVSRGRDRHSQDFPLMSIPLIHGMTTVTKSFYLRLLKPPQHTTLSLSQFKVPAHTSLLQWSLISRKEYC